jgi:hypothetical protein
MADVRVGHGERQVDQHAAIQRQFLNRLRLDHFAEAHVLRLQHLGGPDHGNGLVLLTQLQREIEPHVLADLENDIALLVGETGGAHLQRILAGHQIGHLEQALVVRRGLPGDRGCLRRDRDPRPGNGRLRRILNSSTQRREIALRVNRHESSEEYQKLEHILIRTSF